MDFTVFQTIVLISIVDCKKIIMDIHIQHFSKTKFICCQIHIMSLCFKLFISTKQFHLTALILPSVIIDLWIIKTWHTWENGHCNLSRAVWLWDSNNFFIVSLTLSSFQLTLQFRNYFLVKMLHLLN